VKKLEFMGRLYIVAEWEDYAILITNADKSEIIKNAGYECREGKNCIFCTAIDTSKLEPLGTLLDDVLERFHGKKVRITIEVLDDV